MWPLQVMIRVQLDLTKDGEGSVESRLKGVRLEIKGLGRD
jgi:hypothetical protein